MVSFGGQRTVSGHEAGETHAEHVTTHATSPSRPSRREAQGNRQPRDAVKRSGSREFENLLLFIILVLNVIYLIIGFYNLILNSDRIFTVGSRPF